MMQSRRFVPCTSKYSREYELNWGIGTPKEVMETIKRIGDGLEKVGLLMEYSQSYQEDRGQAVQATLIGWHPPVPFSVYSSVS